MLVVLYASLSSKGAAVSYLAINSGFHLDPSDLASVPSVSLCPHPLCLKCVIGNTTAQCRMGGRGDHHSLKASVYFSYSY